jgi:HD-GYP domain-containing protein (c-di-GMP phosphodiesterase class II)
MNQHILKKYQEKKGEVSFKEEFNLALEQKNFTALIEKTRIEVMAFNINKSHTVSLAIYLCEKLLHEDNMTNRIVAFSYLFAKNCDIKDESALGILICAAFMHHLGLTQIDRDLAFKPVISISDDDKKIYRRHPGLAQHLLKKCGIELDDRVLDIINQHHERFEGGGYPDSKKGAHLDPLALFLAVSSHIFEYAEGYINEQKMSIKAVIMNIKNKTLSAGLELDFGNTIYENLSFLIKEVS